MKPLIATPCYGDMLCVNYVTSLMQLRPIPDVLFRSGALITFIRNECVAEFLAGDWSHLFFIDADVGFSPGAFYRVLFAERDVVAGAAPYRRDGAGFTVDPAEVGEADEEGFAPVQHIGTGFMCIARGALEKMQAAGIGRHEFFDTMRAGAEYLHEDHAFCRRWRNMGGVVWFDTQAVLTHQGSKTYSGDLSAYLNRGTKP